MLIRFLFFALILFFISNISAQKITRASSYYGHPNDTITIYGTGFNSSANAVVLYFGNSYLNILSITSNKIKIKLPQHIINGNITYIDTINKKITRSSFELKTYTSFRDLNYLDKRNFNKVSFTVDTTLKNYPPRFVDINNDGLLEMLVNSVDGKLIIYKNNSRSNQINFQEVYSFNKESYLENVLDVNLDGKIDLVLKNLDTLFFLINKSKNNNIEFKDSLFVKLGYNFNNLNFGFLNDFDGDGRPDITKNYVEDNSDSVIFLNKIDSSGKIVFKPVFPMLNLSSRKITSVDLNMDKLTDFVFVDERVTGKLYFFQNISKLDTIRFKLIDSVDFGIGNNLIIKPINLNNDSLIDYLIHDTRRDSFKILINESFNNIIKFKKIENNFKSKNYTEMLFFDYNSDKKIDVFYSNYNDSIISQEISIRNDSLFSKINVVNSFNSVDLKGIYDINNDNQPDLVNFHKNQPKIEFFIGESNPLLFENFSIFCASDSINHIIYDSIKFYNYGQKKLIIDSVYTIKKFDFYTDNKYNTKIKFPIIAKSDSWTNLYFKHKFLENIKDTFRINKTKTIAEIEMKYIVPPAKINKISHLKARPGDTISIYGKYFFKSINDIFIRMNNRRCKILNTSKDTLLKFVYPALTAATRVLITDTAKKYNTYSNQIIYPTFIIDSSFDFNFKSYKLIENNIYGKHQKYFEKPTNDSNTHYFPYGDCSHVEFDDYVAYNGWLNNNQFVLNNSLKKVYYKQNSKMLDYFGEDINKGEDHLVDINKDGKLDFFIYETDNNSSNFTVYYCLKITDTSVEYSNKNKIQIKANSFSHKYLYPIDSKLYDFDNDGNFDILSSSSNGDTIFILTYNSVEKKLIVNDFIVLNINEVIYGINDYNLDSRKDILILQTTDTNYRYYYRENLSKRGDLVFSKKENLLVESIYSVNLAFDQIHLNNDNKTDLIVKDFFDKALYIYLFDTMNYKLKIVDTFNIDNMYFSYNDIDGDAIPELFGPNIYKIGLKNSKFDLKKLEIDSFDVSNIFVTDVNFDFKPDIFSGDDIYLNLISSAKFDSNNPFFIESSNFNTPKSDSIYIYNNGSSDIHLKDISITDTSFTISVKNDVKILNPIKIKQNDSLKVNIYFNPKVKNKKKYNGMLAATFLEDMPIVYRPVWGYVSLPPSIKKVIPSQIMAGDTVIIFGKNFDNLNRVPLVNFSNSKSKILQYNDTLMLVKAPYGCQEGVITVYDTATDLLGFSPSPLQYTFLGTKNKLNQFSFKRNELRNLYLQRVIDIDGNGFPDILYDSGNGNYFIKLVQLFNYSNKDTLRLENKSVLNNSPIYKNVILKDIDGDNTLERVILDAGSVKNLSALLRVEGSINHLIFDNRETVSSLDGFNVTDVDKDGMIEINFGNKSPNSCIFEINVKKHLNIDDCNYHEYKHDNLQYTNKIKGASFYEYDFDGDGIGEILYNDTFITIAKNLSNNDSFHIGNKYFIKGSKYKILPFVMDYNNDNKIDIIEFTDNSMGDYYINIYKNNSNSDSISFVKFIDTIKGNSINLGYFHLCDFNGDQLPDIYSQEGYGLRDTFRIFTNTSNQNAFSHSSQTKFVTKGKIFEQAFADMNGDSKIDIILGTDSCLQIFLNTSISGRLSRNIDTFNSNYGIDIVKSLKLYSSGGDTLIINKIIIPPNYKLVNNGGSLKINQLNNLQNISLPIKINSQDSFLFQIVSVENKKPGIFRDTFLFFNNESNTPYSYILSGEIKPTPLSYINKDTCYYGKLKKGKNKIDSFILYNMGYDTLRISSYVLSDTINFKLLNNKIENKLRIGDSIKFYVKFLSKNKGLFKATLTINHNDYKKRNIIHLVGETISPVIIDSIAVQFSKIHLNNNVKKSIYVKNTGNDTLIIDSIQLNNFNVFKIVNNYNTYNSIIPNDSLLFDFEFVPDTLKKYWGIVKVFYGSQSSKINLFGNGVGGFLLPRDTIFNLGKIKINKEFKFVHKIQNKGNYNLKIKSIVDNNNLKIKFCNNNVDSLIVGNEYPLCLNAKFNEDGLRKDTVLLYNSGYDSLINYVYCCEVIKPIPIVSVSKKIFNTPVFKKHLSFVTIFNAGTDTLDLQSANLSNTKYFSLIDSTSSNKRILPQGQYIYTIQFNPLDTQKEYSLFSLRFLNDTTFFKITLEGLGLLGIPIFDKKVKVESKINQSIISKFTLKNLGNYKLSKISLKNNNYNIKVNYNRDSVLSKDSLMINIEFSPKEYLNKIYDTIRIFSFSDSIALMDTMYLEGVALYPEIDFNINNMIKFPNTKVADTSNYNLIVYNKGNDTLIANFNKLNNYHHEFEQQNIVVLPFDKKNINIKFNPNKKRLYFDTIVVKSNAKDSINKFYINGNGVFNSSLVKLFVSKSEINFGEIKVNSTKLDSFDLFNFGNDTLYMRLKKNKNYFNVLNDTNFVILPSNKHRTYISFYSPFSKSYLDTLFILNIENDTLKLVSLLANTILNNHFIISNYNGIDIFPNPSNDVVRIYSKIGRLNKDFMFLRNILGEIIEVKFNTINNVTEFNVSELPNGIYFLNILVNENTVLVHKIIVNH